MIQFIAYVVGSILALRYLWILFLAVMALQDARNEGRITPAGLRFGYTVLAEGWVVDFIIQVTIANLIWLELPRELTVSARVKRLTSSAEDSWRKRHAQWWEKNLLGPFDRTGRHGGRK